MADQMTRLVVDSPSLFYRAFFALPKSIKGPDGNSVNAVRGYLDMVSRVLVDQRPRAVANVFDADWRITGERAYVPQGSRVDSFLVLAGSDAGPTLLRVDREAAVAALTAFRGGTSFKYGPLRSFSNKYQNRACETAQVLEELIQLAKICARRALHRRAADKKRRS